MRIELAKQLDEKPPQYLTETLQSNPYWLRIFDETGREATRAGPKPRALQQPHVESTGAKIFFGGIGSFGIVLVSGLIILVSNVFDRVANN
ncbi:MAG: hypothetical protein WCC90_13380 [Methylocella sp.]